MKRSRRNVDFYKKKKYNDETVEEMDVSGDGGEGGGCEIEVKIESCEEEEAVGAADRLEGDHESEAEGKKKKYHFQPKWLAEFAWLRYEEQTMFCIYCRMCGPAVAGRTNFVEGSKHFKLESIKLHNDSVKHKKCRGRAQCIISQAQPLPTPHLKVESNLSAENAEIIIKFNTAYHIVKEELPFSKFKSQITLMKKNGLDVNPTHANDVACAQFVGVIGDTLREKAALRIAHAPYISFMIDGSTDMSTKESEICYARIIEDGKPAHVLVGHIEVEHAHAEGVYAAAKKAFASLGPACVNWQEKIVAMGADGAADNLGHRGGVMALLQEEIGSFIVPFHCMAHRLELALLSVQRDVSMIGQVYDLLHLVWKTYRMSPKSMRELRALGAEIGFNTSSGLKGTRWLPHVSRSLSTLLKPEKGGDCKSSGQFTAVYVHMDHLAGASVNAEIAGRAKKIKASMEDGTFVAFCHFLSDLFSLISKYSLLLQRNDITLPQAVSGIESLVTNIEAMSVRPKPGGKLSEFLEAMKKQSQDEGGEPGEFVYQDVYLSKGEVAELAGGEPISRGAPKLHRAIGLTCESTVKHLKSRFSSLLETNAQDIPTAKAVRCFNIFNRDSWPEDKMELLDYGVVELNFLLQHFSTVLDRNGCSREQAKEEFTDMKMTIHTAFKDKSYLGVWHVMMTKEPYCSVYMNILHLVKIMLVLPISSAICERGFSTVNRIKSDARASLHTDTVEDLIRISVEGPTLEDYDARQDVEVWLSQGMAHRRPNFKSSPVYVQAHD